MPALILVRHSTPMIDPAVPSTAWGLSDEGRLAARALGEALVWFEPAAILSSPERKAHDTAAAIAAWNDLPIVIDDDLREHERDQAGFLPREEFVTRIEQLLRSSSKLVFGSETADAVFLRLNRAIDRARQASPDRDQLVVSHGTAISIYVGHILGLDPIALWHELKTPTAVIIQDGKLELLSPVGAGLR